MIQWNNILLSLLWQKIKKLHCSWNVFCVKFESRNLTTNLLGNMSVMIISYTSISLRPLKYRNTCNTFVCFVISKWIHFISIFKCYQIIYVFVWVCFPFFLGHLESDGDTLWHECALWPRNGSKTIKFQKKLFSAELLPFFYISLRFLCKFEERL